MHVVEPEGVDDPTRPSGGNVYDRRLCDELTRAGWAVGERATSDNLAEVLAALPDDRVVLVDGLVAVAAPHDVVEQAHRLRLVVLLHMPFGERDVAARFPELTVLSVASAVVTTSEWSRRWLVDHYALRPERIHVAEPGVDHAEIAAGSEAGGELLCVAAVTADKGHAVLLAALAGVADLSWRLTCVGSLERDPELARRLQRHAQALGIAERVTWTGARVGARLDRAYAAADALVLSSRAESWGMVVGEALARGLPVIASEVGGVPEALGHSPAGHRPGLLVPAGDATALAEALRHWLTDDAARHDLRAAARARRTTLAGWPVTAGRVAQVLTEVAR